MAPSSGGAWYAITHGQCMLAVVGDGTRVGALLGLALIVLSIVTGVLAKLRSWLTARRAGVKDAMEAVANLLTLSIAEFHALAEVLENGVTRMSLHHGSILADVWRKGVLRLKRRASALKIICEIHPAVGAIQDQIIARWDEDVRERRVPESPSQSLGWMGR